MRVFWVLGLIGVLFVPSAHAQMGMATGFMFGYMMGSGGAAEDHPAVRAGVPGRCLAARDEGEYKACRKSSLEAELIRGQDCGWKDVRDTAKRHCSFEFNVEMEMRWLKALGGPKP